MVFGIIMVFGCLGLAFCLWGLFCNSQTYNDRVKLINFVFHDPMNPYLALLPTFHKVTYENHMWQRVFFHDWRALYDKDFITKYEIFKQHL